MKMNFLKYALCTTLLAAGLILTSCKDNKETDSDTETETLEPMEPSYDDNTDTIMTDIDSITAANREDKSMPVTDQVP